jgi:hypothetical protein
MNDRSWERVRKTREARAGAGCVSSYLASMSQSPSGSTATRIQSTGLPAWRCVGSFIYLPAIGAKADAFSPRGDAALEREHK